MRFYPALGFGFMVASAPTPVGMKNVMENTLFDKLSKREALPAKVNILYFY